MFLLIMLQTENVNNDGSALAKQNLLQIILRKPTRLLKHFKGTKLFENIALKSSAANNKTLLSKFNSTLKTKDNKKIDFYL